MIAKTYSRIVPAPAGAALRAVPASIDALAQSHGYHVGHAGQPPKPAGAGSDATKAFEAANAKMHAGMTVKATGTAGVDFVRGMVPHRQGAPQQGPGAARAGHSDHS